MIFSDILIASVAGIAFYFLLDIALFYFSKYILKKDLLNNHYSIGWIKDQEIYNKSKKEENK